MECWNTGEIPDVFLELIKCSIFKSWEGDKSEDSVDDFTVAPTLTGGKQIKKKTCSDVINTNRAKRKKKTGMLFCVKKRNNHTLLKTFAVELYPIISSQKISQLNT